MVKKVIGWIGVGAMGDPMARRLMDGGHTIVVLKRPSENTRRILQDGAIGVSSMEEMAGTAEYIFTMIPKAAVLEQAASALRTCETARSVRAIIDMSTLAPKDSLRVSEQLEKLQIGFLRAPVTGSTSYAASGHLGIMASGPKRLFDEVLPLLQILGDRQTWLGEGEEARYYKIAINMLLGNLMQALAESIVFGEKAGLDYKTLIDLIADSAGAAPLVKYRAENLKARDFSPMSVAYNTDKDMGIAMEIAEDHAAILPMTAFSRQMYASMRARGMQNLDMCALLLLNEEMSGIYFG